MELNLITEEPTSSVLAQARAMYFLSVPTQKISAILEVSEKYLEKQILGENKLGTDPSCWKVVRNSMTDVVVNTIMQTQLETTMNIVGLASAALKNGLQDILQKSEDGELNVRDMKALSDIIVNMDKIARLERMTPTDIIQTQGLSLHEARDILTNDPFFSAIRAEYEVKDERTDNEDASGTDE